MCPMVDIVMGSMYGFCLGMYLLLIFNVRVYENDSVGRISIWFEKLVSIILCIFLLIN